ncbi:endonuclease [Marinobacter caseinilyticus]|uniref:endonuclease n=1 Tax=Marinobacter caseinilyticus TaxID=2692195 RepID=UPI0014084753|nr:endonuclease [Marinobacter caseinilyticus]
MNKTLQCLLMALSLLPSLSLGQNPFSDAEANVRDRFWNQLYAEGGSSFFCNTPFTSKGFLLTDGYVYPLIHVRNALQCGTSSQCESNKTYRRIARDLHNIVPVQSRIEMRRRNAKYSALDPSVTANECGIRESTQFIEPPDNIKGDVARIIGYMVNAYQLPWLGVSSTFRQWNEQDPPDDQERVRHQRIVDIQGNENPFILEPSRMATL